MAAKGQGLHRETARHHQVFEQWYGLDRDSAKVAKEYGLNDKTIRNWALKYDWDARADARDREAIIKADKEAIERRAAMLAKCREAGQLLVTRGIERLQTGPIVQEQTAIAAIGKGVEVWRQSEGLPTWAVEIMAADVSTLEQLERDLDRRRRAAFTVSEESAPGETPALPEPGANGSG